VDKIIHKLLNSPDEKIKFKLLHSSTMINLLKISQQLAKILQETSKNKLIKLIGLKLLIKMEIELPELLQLSMYMFNKIIEK